MKNILKRADSLLIILGILFVSFNLRAVITAVGSIVEMIQDEYTLTNASAGFITTLPLISFAIVSPFVARIAKKLGHGKTMMLGLLLILFGELCRSYLGALGLFAGTAILGVGIAIGNVIIPAIIKLHFSEKVGVVTSIYTSGMCIFAAVGAGISVPLAQGANLGWKNTLASWVFLTILTVFIWLPQVKRKPHGQVLEEMQERKAKELEAAKIAETETPEEKRKTSIWKSSTAWWVTLFMGTQSLLFYSLVAWLPTIVMSKGMSSGFAGNMALLFQLMAIPATLIVPTLSDKFKDQKMLALGTCIVYGLGMTFFLIGQSQFLLALAVICMAIGMGGSISLSIAFISLRTPNSAKASELSGMSQSAGYLLAALGPIITGYIFDLRSSWTLPLFIFIALIGFLALCGLFAGRDKTVEE